MSQVGTCCELDQHFSHVCVIVQNLSQVFDIWNWANGHRTKSPSHRLFDPKVFILHPKQFDECIFDSVWGVLGWVDHSFYYKLTYSTEVLDEFHAGGVVHCYFWEGVSVYFHWICVSKYKSCQRFCRISKSRPCSKLLNHFFDLLNFNFWVAVSKEHDGSS